METLTALRQEEKEKLESLKVRKQLKDKIIHEAFKDSEKDRIEIEEKIRHLMHDFFKKYDLLIDIDAHNSVEQTKVGPISGAHVKFKIWDYKD